MSSALARLPYRCGASSNKGRGRGKQQQQEPTSFVLATSRLFASQPAYVTEQPPFLNAAAAVVTRLPPLRLLRALKGLERDAGRGKESGPAVRFGPRPLDLDVVFYGGVRGSLFEDGNEREGGEDRDAAADAVSAAVSQGLELPHPRWRERAFVMAPACDLVGGAEGSAERDEREEREERFASGLRLFGFLPGGDGGGDARIRRRPSLRPPGLPFPLPSRGSAEAVSRSLCEVAQRCRELCSSSSSTSSSSSSGSSSASSFPSPEADCRLSGGAGGSGSGASSCWPVLPLPHGLGGWRAQAERPRIMAVLNVTPDSFSDGGRLMAAAKKGKEASAESGGGSSRQKSSGGADSEDSDPPTDVPAVLAAARLAVSRGADLLDVGGQSTRPGAKKVSEELEARRVVSAVRALAADERLKALKIPISVDTFYASVAEKALEAGAHIINDVTGGKGDRENGKMAAAVARGGGVLILTHNRGGGSGSGKVKSSSSSFDPSGGSADSDYGAYGGEVAVGVAEELAEAVESAVAGVGAGAAAAEGKKKSKNDDDDDVGDDFSSSSSLLLPWSLVLDPGLGFSKTRAQNLSLLARTEEIRAALPPQLRTMPVLVGASRKGFLGAAGGGGVGAGAKGGGRGKNPDPDLDHHPRDAATFASSALAAAGGADLLRVHEVARNREAAGVGASVRWAKAEVGGGGQAK